MDRPKRVKWYKTNKQAFNRTRVEKVIPSFGEYGMILTEPGRRKPKQFEAIRVVIRRTMDREGKLWINAFPTLAITSKPLSTRMGKGKGAISHYVSPVREGQLLLEVTGVSEKVALKAFAKASAKLGIKTKVVKRRYPLA